MINLVYKGLVYVPDPTQIPKVYSYSSIDQGASYAHIDMATLANNYTSDYDSYEAWVVLDTPKGKFVSDWHSIGEWKDPSSYWNGANNFYMAGAFYDTNGNQVTTVKNARQENGVFYLQHTFGSITVDFDKATMYAVANDAMYQKWHDLTIRGGEIPTIS